MDEHQSDSGGSAGVHSQPLVGHPGVFRDLLPMAVWANDQDGRVWQWALAAENLLGWQAKDMLGQDGFPLLVPEPNRELARELVARTRAGETVVGAYPVRHQDGHLVEMEMWISPIPNPHGGPGTLVIAAETSAVKRMRDSLAALEGLFSQSPIGLALFDCELRYVRVNNALAAMNGVPATAHVGKQISEIVPGIDHAAAEASMRQVLTTGRAVVDLRTGRTAASPDQDRIWSCSYAPLTDSDGEPLGVIASVIDITKGQADHVRAERARQRFALLAEAGERIGTTLDLRQAAEGLAQMLVPQLADTAEVLLLEGVLAPDDVGVSTHGLLHCLAVAGLGSAAPAQQSAPEVTYRVPPDSVYTSSLAKRRPRTVPLPLPTLRAVPADPHCGLFAASTPGWARVVPLDARGKVLGLVIVTRTRSEPFDEQDTVLIDELVDRAALNIDNARLYASRREAALTLQRSLIKPLPTVPGLELASGYLPASSDNEVGGDWLDVLTLPDGRTGLIIGDVMGHGIRAAAVMGQLRVMARTLACQNVPPDRLLQHLDSTVADLGDYELATCAYAVYDPATSSCLITRAGHPPPALADPHGTVRFLDTPCGAPLGACPDDPYDTEQVPLPPGTLLALYTDGLIESHDTDLEQGLNQLAHALCTPDRTLEKTRDHLLAHLLPTPAQDDVAVLLARPR
ncbi:SpoIIE family protein phosphatase [Streptomyces sp. HUAS TT20]|uniref:SpoIIE family protein phosphatase n=1 Tax=Streptomyces sp. HUAS TT20 TaxID=3447509 RepID=UPI0021DB0091|nr:SpoIIE family protein phosphatase [Streptomyces sp. HUAS 15-9]UXY32318.1 SpoIIE family protein phosphatase [Streptomyces sp. HUAS 15-9]